MWLFGLNQVKLLHTLGPVLPSSLPPSSLPPATCSQNFCISVSWNGNGGWSRFKKKVSLYIGYAAYRFRLPPTQHVVSNLQSSISNANNSSILNRHMQRLTFYPFHILNQTHLCLVSIFISSLIHSQVTLP